MSAPTGGSFQLRESEAIHSKSSVPTGPQGPLGIAVGRNYTVSRHTHPFPPYFPLLLPRTQGVVLLPSPLDLRWRVGLWCRCGRHSLAEGSWKTGSAIHDYVAVPF